MSKLPIITCAAPEAVIARRGLRAISARQFLGQAARLAMRLPAGAPLLNLCEDRYQFALGLVAGLLAGRCTLLPPTRAPEVLRQMHAQHASLVALGDQPAVPEVLAQLGCPWLCVTTAEAAPEPAQGAAEAAAAPWSIPQVEAETAAVLIYTSGSSGPPVAHLKTFGQLVEAARVQLTRLPGSEHAAGNRALLGTVPAQHMFGLEATVILPLQGGGVLCAERPFFPADVVAALQRLARPRALVATPVHLRALVDAAVTLPPLDLVLCATAPLPAALAREVESRSGAALVEIFGSTETGQIASRRTAHEQAWHLWPQVRLRLHAERWWAQGGHVRVPTPLADTLEPLDEAHFLLQGRTADLVNVAGKRSSLAHLTQQLLAIPGVVDGAFFLRDGARGSLTGVSRLAAMAVAPGITRAQLLTALRERIDAVFLPRPLWLVEQLPRNATGKLPQEALQRLAAQLSAQRAAGGA